MADLIDRARRWSHNNRQGLSASAKSMSWLSGDTLASTLVGAVVSVIVARTLGASAVGTWGYVFAIYSICLLLTTLGMDQIMLLDLVAAREPRSTIVATALMLRLAASLLVAAIMIGTTFAFAAGNSEQDQLLRMLGISLLAMSFDVIGNSFRAQRRFDRVVIPSVVSILVGGAAKAFLVIRQHSILPLGYLTVAQSALMQGLILLSATRSGVGIAWRGFSLAYARELLRISLPLMISGIAVFVYLRANIFFLNEFDSKTDVGLYNAAAAVSGIAYFLPTIMVTALTPSLYRLHTADPPRFIRSLQHLSSFLTVALATIAVVVMLLSNRIITLLYGPSFAPAAAVLSIHVWTLIPVAYGLTSSVWLAANKRTGALMTRTVCGGVANLALNVLLIPRWGIVGAAIATLISMLIASMLMLVFLGPLGRQIFAFQMRSLFLVDLLATLAPRRAG
jgi:polysaccharide transporter, PST family